MKITKETIVASVLLAILAAVGATVLGISRDDGADAASAAVPAKQRRAIADSARGRSPKRIIGERTKPGANAPRIPASGKSQGLDADEEADLSPEMKKVLAELQDCIDGENRAALTRVCNRISRIMRERGEGAVPPSVRARAVEAIGLFLPESLAELVGFMADSDPEVLESVFDKVDELMNDTTVGDRKLSELLVSLSKALTNEDAIDSMALTIDMNMRNSVKAMTCSKILDEGTDAVVSRIRETIADMLDVETSELPASKSALKQSIKDWLAENPDDEDDNDLYNGVDD